MPSITEENYLKHVYLLCDKNGYLPVTTNDVSAAMEIKPASATDMLQRLSAKKLIHYKKYQGVLLTQRGKEKALAVIRKHRLWEYFLVHKLQFGWDQVHNVAEELEHVESDLLIDKLDQFLGHPKFDPHGDPIPDARGRFSTERFWSLSTLKENQTGTVAGVIEQSASFLNHLDKLKIHIGSTLKVASIREFDKSMSISVGGKRKELVTHDIAKNILVSK